MRCSPAPLASSPSSTASSTTPKSSPSTANPTVSRKPLNAPIDGRGSGRRQAHEQAGQRRSSTGPAHDPGSLDPDAALAVFDLVDDLRDQIWRRYGLVIQDELRRQTDPD